MVNELSNTIAKTINTQEKIKRELASSARVNTILALSQGQVLSIDMPTVIQKEDFTGTTSLIWDNDDYGIWDSFDWGDDSPLGEYATYQIYNPSNTWSFFGTEAESDVWTNPTSTATMDFSGKQITLPNGTFWESNKLSTEIKTITKLTPVFKNMVNDNYLAFYSWDEEAPMSPPAISFINYSYIGGSTGTSRIAPKPTSTASGDYMFAMISTRSGYATTIPTGWSLLAQSQPVTDYRFELYYKVAGASEPADYTWEFPINARSMIITSSYRLNFTPKPITAISNTDYITDDTIARAASMNVSTANSALLYFGSVYHTSAKTFTKPANLGSDVWTEDMDYGHVSPDFWTTMGSIIWTGSGATGNIDLTISASDVQKHVFAIALEPSSTSTTAGWKEITPNIENNVKNDGELKLKIQSTGGTARILMRDSSSGVIEGVKLIYNF